MSEGFLPDDFVVAGGYLPVIIPALVDSSWFGYSWIERELMRQKEDDDRRKINTLQEQGYTEPFINEGEWWMYPPNAVMPVMVDSLFNK